MSQSETFDSGSPKESAAPSPQVDQISTPVPNSASEDRWNWRDVISLILLLSLLNVGGWLVYRTLIQEGVDKPKVVDPNAPSLFIDQALLDLGDIALDDGEVMPVSFAYENRGGGVLTISDIVATCSCTGATASRKVLAPGETGEISVQIKRSSLGHGSATLLVYSDDPISPRLDLKVQWNGIARLKIEPTSLDFGDVLPGATSQRELKLIFQDGQRHPECQMVQIDHTRELKVHRYAGSRLKEPLSEETLFNVSLQAGRNLGSGNGSVRISFSGCYKDEFVIPVTWNVRSRIEVLPRRLFMGTGSVGETLKKKVVISAAAPDRLDIKSARLHPEGIGTATLRFIRDDCQDVEVVLKLAEQDVNVQGMLILECLEPVAETLEVPLSAVVVPAKTSPPGKEN